ncbi:MAG: transcription-repair coupling factor [Planctomycetota bacterium]|nr:transcription-repair coupling factor [Planctomycetota bacterium]
MFKRILSSEPVARIAGMVRVGGVVKLTGVWGSSAPLLAAAVGELKKRPVLLVVSGPDEADSAADDIEVFTGPAAEIFPAWEMGIAGLSATDAPAPDHLNDEITGQRLRLCALLAGDDERPGFIVASAMSLMQPVPMPEVLAAARMSLRTGGETDLRKLLEWLVDAGFESVDAVDQAGQFARRGGIVDVFPPAGDLPVRIEFFGEKIESIRRFDPDTQRSTAQISGCDLVAISAGRETGAGRTTHLLNYLPDGAIVCFIEPDEVRSTAEAFYRRLIDPACRKEGAGVVHGPETLFRADDRLAVMEMSAFAPAGRAGKVVPMGIASLQRLQRPEEALDELERLAGENEVWVYCENAAEMDRFGELLSGDHAELAAKVHKSIGHVDCGFHWPAQRLVVVGHHEIFHRYARRRTFRRLRAGRPIESFMDLAEGDYVVHLTHGIARFVGFKTLKTDGRSEEFLTLRFAGGSLLHVPVTEIQLVQKYIGAGRARPSLSRLGSSAWSLRKDRVAIATRDLAAELLRLQAVRNSSPGISYTGDSDWMRRFEQEFTYTETPDQITAMREISADMAEARPMDRLLCGDVGYGKTELAMRAAFRVVEAGRQVAVLVPTTVLAAQHYRTFSERFADYPVTVEVLSRFRSKGEAGKISESAAAGKIDILIGTHRLLSGDVQFADLGLVVIDEEQRFGVEHKEHLKRMRAEVDVLTMTATPIPRTLHMALMGLRDISSLATAPLDRRAVFTEVCRSDDKRIRAAIGRELDRKGQVFFVHNRVFDIEQVTDHIRSIAPEARVQFAHGQMPKDGLEKTMLSFVAGDIDVLVCTTIIESGLDIPSANTMFIRNADRFGLAQLHQLRGRIGRYKHRAYCCLLLPTDRSVSRVAARRLKAVEEFSDLGAGFQIAMRDLEIRGAGNILGSAQSGHIAAVGYELYCQLLEQAVAGLRGEKITAPPAKAHVELAGDTYIPRSYISSARQRMEVYRRLAMCRTSEELSQLSADLTDVFGPISPVVGDLLSVAEIRLLAGKTGIDRIVLMRPDVIFTLSDPALADSALAGLAGSVRLVDEHTAYWRPPSAYLERSTLLAVLMKRLRRADERV